jgi:hypothetical protein
MRVSTNVRMGSAELGALLFRPEMLGKWIGAGVILPFRKGALATVPAPGGSLAQHMVTHATVGEGVFTLTAECETSGTSLTIRVGPVPGPATDDGRSVVRVTVGNIREATGVRSSLAFWQAALNRLSVIVQAIRRRRNSPKQALIVIHGIGEQQPGQTLMEFVQAVFGTDSSQTLRWVKPDNLSDSFETRKVTIKAAASPPGAPGEGRPTTDVYELYWAHLVRDSTTGQVMGWMKNLLLRKSSDMPASLRPHVRIVRILLVVVLLAFVGATGYAAFKPASSGGMLAGSGLIAVVIALLGLVWKLLKQRGTKLLTGHLGDAARYFEPKPDNIARRQEIREAGVRLLEGMHESGEYQRIVVAAHSLGSAIAYDMLTFTWNRLRQQHADPDHASFGALGAVESALMPRDPEAAETPAARDLQYAAWQEHRLNSQPWLVTDLVTMGSPLTHAHLLMAGSNEAFSSMKKNRILPSCPPQAEFTAIGQPRISYALSDRSMDGSFRGGFLVPNHGALFALTRWTNLYFPFHGIIGGDPVGGPLKGNFGDWISDRPVRTRKAGFMGFAHTRYWALDGGDGAYVGQPGEDHLDCLREALDLYSASRLRDLAAARPAYTYL